MTHAQKPYFVFLRNGRVHLNRPGGGSVQSTTGSRGVRISGSKLDTPRSEVVWRVLATHCIRQFPLHFPTRASPCAITFQLQSTSLLIVNGWVHLNRRGASVQSTTGSRGLRISGSNAGYTMFRGSVKNTRYPLNSPVSPSLPHPWVTVCHHISTGLYGTCLVSPLWR